MATMLLQSPAAIKQQFQAWDQQLSARGAAPTVAREVAQSARAQRFDPTPTPTRRPTRAVPDGK